jgi:hypothetical protein
MSRTLAAAPRIVRLLATLALLAAGAAADEVRLHDGRVLVGRVAVRDGRLEITTRDGVIVVAEQEVAERIPEATLRERLARLARSADDSAFAQLQLAMQAHQSGLEPELWRHLDRAVPKLAAEPANASLQRRCAEFLARLEPELLPPRLRGAPAELRVRHLLDGLHASTGPGRAAAIDELLVREPAADEVLRKQARGNPNPRQRLGALQALQRRPLAGNDRFVLRTAVLDGTEAVRTAAAAMCRGRIGPDDIQYLATGLAHDHAKIRVRTAEALAELGDAEAARFLVLAGPHAGKGLAAGANTGVRAHIAVLQQTSYVRDFDVEIASAAMIADPQVDVLTSGTVLDVTVAGVVEERTIVRAYRRAIQRLLQRDPGADPRTWAQWFENARPPAAAPTTGPR